MSFPPAKGNKVPVPPAQVKGEEGPFSTGKGGLPTSLKLKNSLIVASPGVEKTNSAS